MLCKVFRMNKKAIISRANLTNGDEAKNLIIYVSVHHGNTLRIAEAMAEVLDAELAKPQDVNMKFLSRYNLIGFGSGIYHHKHHRRLLNFVDELPHLKNKRAFIFSTSGIKKMRLINDFGKLLREKLLKKGVNIIGEFSCRGFDTYGYFKLIGGINKSRPDEMDIEQAKKFAWNLKKETMLVTQEARVL